MITTRRVCVLLMIVLGLLAVAAPAWAHVHVEADNTRPGAQATYVIAVPNESETATTDRIEVQLPDGLEITDTAPGRGWTMRVENGVIVIEGGAIKPGDTREFRFTAINPPQRGELVFPAIQTYSDGEEVRWVGEGGSDRPAPTVVLEGRPVPASPPPEPSPTPTPAEPTESPTTPAATPSAAATAAPPATAAPTAAATAEPEAESGGGGLSPTVIVLVALAVIAGFLALVARNRRQS